jgi:hypothetical protein
MIKSYQIKKIMVKNGKPQHVILLGSNSEVYETSCFGEATKLCELLNTNTDSGWRYEIITIGNK